MGSSGRPARLSRSAILEAALAIADTGGLGHVTVRRLAQALGVAPMAIYRHFRSKEELLDELPERVLSRCEPAPPGGAGVRQELHTLLGGLRRELVAHPGAIPLLGRASSAGPGELRIAEALARALRRAGLEAPTAARGVETLLGYTVGFALLECRERARGEAPREGLHERRRRARLRLEALPRHEYPHLVELAGELAEGWSGTRFHEGLDRVIRGLRPATPRVRARARVRPHLQP